MKTLRYQAKGYSIVHDPITGKETRQESLITIEGEEATEENIARVKGIAVNGLYELLDNASASSLYSRLAKIEEGWTIIKKLLNIKD